MTHHTNATGLYSYSGSDPRGDGFLRFYKTAISIFEKLGITPTHFAAEGVGFKGDLVKIGGRAHEKALQCGFKGVDVVSLICSEEASNEPAAESLASASFGFVEHSNETLLTFTIDEQLLALDDPKFLQVLDELLQLQKWDYGFSICQPAEKKPEFHVLGIDPGKLSPDDQRRLNAWYAATPDERVHKIRDVYPINFVNRFQLSAKISGVDSLEQYILNDLNSSIKQLENRALWLWVIKPEGVEIARKWFADSGVSIA